VASIFRREGRDGRKAAKYSIKYKDENGGWKTVAGCIDLASTRKLASKLEADATLRRNGLVAKEESVPILPIPYDAFEVHLTAKGDTPHHVAQTIDKVRRTFAGCGFHSLDDLRDPDAASKVTSFLLTKKRQAKRKPIEQLSKRVVYDGPEKCSAISPRTRNAYMVAIKTFCKWCVKNTPLTDCKLIFALERAKESTRPVRRAADDAELESILTAARNGEPVGGLSGEERYWLYRVAITTGFRASELRALTPSHFKLTVSIPHVELLGDATKNGDDAYQPIRAEFADELRRWLKGKPVAEPVWPGLWHKKAAAMLRDDLEAAGVPYSVDGRVLDFHALRSTFITSLSRAGVHPKTAQILARHSDIKLTMQTYTHLSLAEVAGALPSGAPNAHQGGGKVGQNVSLDVISKERRGA
jgi:integrase